MWSALPMRAVVCDRLGDPSVLKIEDGRSPRSARRRSDQGRRRFGQFPRRLMLSAGYQHKPELPFIPGMEGAGTIGRSAPR